jgi:tetratricopeptide (TPR) repeat protein
MSFLLQLTTLAFAAAMPAAAQLASSTTPAREEAPPVDAAKQDLTPEQRGDIMMARKQYREAAEFYAPGAKESPVLANKLGIAHHQMMQYELARKWYRHAIKLNPKYGEAINNLGTVLYARKKYRSAISQYRKALKLQPYSASVYSNLGFAEFARKRYDDAMAAFTKAMQIDPQVFERRTGHGVLLQERNVQQERSRFYFFLAKAHAQQGTTDKALFYMRKALEEGFAEKDKFEKDEAFAKLRELAEFQELMKLEPRVL